MSKTKRYKHAVDFGNYSILSMTEGVDRQPLFIRSIRANVPMGKRPQKFDEKNPIVVYKHHRVHFGANATYYSQWVPTAVDQKTDPTLALLMLLATVKPVHGETVFELELNWICPDPDKYQVDQDGNPSTVGDVLTRAFAGEHKFIRNGIEMTVNIVVNPPQHEGLAPAVKARKIGLIPSHGHCVVVDIGGGTVNVLVVNDQHDIIDSASWDKAGGVGLANEIASNSLVKARVGDELNLGYIMDAIANGTYQYCGDPEKSFADIFPECRDAWWLEKSKQIITRFSSHQQRTTSFLFIGGNTNILTDWLNSRPKTTVKFIAYPNPQYANLDALVDDQCLALV